jgi:hypothetical protein
MSDESYSVGSRVDHELYGEGIISQVNFTNYEIFFEMGGKRSIAKDNDELSLLEQEEENNSGGGGISFGIKDLEEMMTRVLDRYASLSEVIELGDRWEDGTMILQPGKEGLQSKEIPMDTFFHKIVMMRDRLRVLEQNINSHPKLNEEDKVHLQQYITRCYGSMTTFNILFANKEDQFSSK